MLRKCSHCFRVLNIGEKKCKTLACVEIRKSEAKAKRKTRIKSVLHDPDYYERRKHGNHRCRSCGLEYECFYKHVRPLPVNYYFGTCNQCKAKQKAS